MASSRRFSRGADSSARAAAGPGATVREGAGGGVRAAEAAPTGSPAGGAQSGPPSGATQPVAGWGASADLGTPTTLVLLRHGETALSPQKRFSGSGGGDPELSERGRAQADAAAAAIVTWGTSAGVGAGTGRAAIQVIVSSPLSRCRQTAKAVADRLGLEVQIEEGLRETDFGAFEGLTFSEVKERAPAELDAWLASDTVAPPGGESFAEVARRVAVARDAVLSRHAGRSVLVVSHVTPVKTLVRLALGAPPESLFRMELSTASISEIQYYADGNASLRLLNDTSHLS